MLTAIRSAYWVRRSSPLRLCRFWARDERGSMAILTGISLTVLVAFAGLGVDVSLWLRAKNDVQGAADAAANSVGAAAALGNPANRIQAEADAAAATTGFRAGMNGVTVTVNNPPASGAHAGNANAYEVIIRAPQKLYLASVLSGVTAPTVTGRAVALLNRGTKGPTCILGLSPLAAAVDVTFNGNTVVTANDCSVDADSPSSSSINTNGGGSVHAKNVRTVGGVSGGNIFVADSPGIFTHSSSTPDPYADRTMPSMPAGSGPNKWGDPKSSNTTIQNTGTGDPPVMTINGNVDVKGNTTLSPGIYIINNGSFNDTGQYTVTGNGVTLILTSSTPASDNGTFSVTGGGGLNLTAPTTGPTAGIALWADGNLPNKEDTFAGGTTSNLVGSIYAPSHDVKYAGNGNTASKCMQLVAYNVIFTGTSTFNHNCDGTGVSDPPLPTTWTLVE
jgi:Flp pilus assembly protein TadG